jgi:hypothetical protein
MSALPGGWNGKHVVYEWDRTIPGAPVMKPVGLFDGPVPRSDSEAAPDTPGAGAGAGAGAAEADTPDAQGAGAPDAAAAAESDTGAAESESDTDAAGKADGGVSEYDSSGSAELDSQGSWHCSVTTQDLQMQLEVLEHLWKHTQERLEAIEARLVATEQSSEQITETLTRLRFDSEEGETLSPLTALVHQHAEEIKALRDAVESRDDAKGALDAKGRWGGAGSGMTRAEGRWGGAGSGMTRAEGRRLTRRGGAPKRSGAGDNNN